MNAPRPSDRQVALRRMVGERALALVVIVVIMAVVLPRAGVAAGGRLPALAVPLGLVAGAALFAAVARPDRTWTVARRTPIGRTVAGGMVLVGAAAEEAVFRGALLVALGATDNPMVAAVLVVVSAGAFAAVHARYGRAAAVTQLTVGAVLALLAVTTGGLVAPVVAHWLYNTAWFECRPPRIPPVGAAAGRARPPTPVRSTP